MYEAVVAASRFGYGTGPAGMPAVGADPKRWLKNQLAAPARPSSLNGLPDSASLVVAELELREARKEMKQNGETGQPPEAKEVRRHYLDEIQARYLAATDSPTPLIERLVAFWSNHFTVSGIRPVVRPLAGAFEREAIRPHILGSFTDLVYAVVQHPAMGFYLDNAISVGPDSKVGQRRDKGLNENLGRELLELHTLGVDGGYTEQDVRALARILTGWSMGRLKDPEPGRFRFFEPIHEPGPKTLLGKTYPEGGMREGLEAIIDLSQHPSTARHIARKLAVHFIVDQPPQAAIDRLAAVFRESHGNLRAVTEALIDLPESWQGWQKKVKTPWDLVVSASVATGVRLPAELLQASLNKLGQAVFMAPSPAGWGDDAASWVGPEAVLRRVEWCQSFADRADAALDPVMVAEGAVLQASTRNTVSLAESRPMALAMVLASPEFQRR